ncbi:hypothetical protein BX592_11198 [Paraburkholderia rhizosphaerae]|uniref:Uncharacterized protein n=1 Tax=Paraburkholderia rhizosphaerae TaxID=480658 RepID=A0A4R8LRI4_9BURK|nr:hypothetical protein BX592_11198 [Paraburkholderia rhizosphaerae]
MPGYRDPWTLRENRPFLTDEGLDASLACRQGDKLQALPPLASIRREKAVHLFDETFPPVWLPDIALGSRSLYGG